MNESRAIAWNTVVQFAGKAVSTAIGVVIVGLMTRYLGETGFGLYSTANAYFQVFVLILDFGLNVTLAQMLGEYRGNPAMEKSVVSATYTFRFITSFVLLTGAAIVGLFLPYPLELRLAFIAIWASFFSTALNQIVIGVQQRHLKMHIVVLGDLLGRIVLLGGIFLARAEGWGLVPIVAMVSVGSVANFLLNYIIARKYADFSWNVDVKMWKHVLTRSWPIGVSIFFNLIYYKADTLILSRYRSFAEVGLYGAAYRVLDVLTTLPFMYMGVVLPILSHAWHNTKPRFFTLLEDAYLTMMLCAAPIVAGTIALSSRIMTLVAGPDFAAAGPILSLLVVAAGVIFLGTVSSHAIVALNQQRKMLAIYVITAVITLAGYMWLIPQYGMWAAAGLTLFSETVVALASTFFTFRASQFKLKLLPLIKVLLAAAIMYLTIYPLANGSLITTIVVGIIVYVGLILSFGIISDQTLKDILSFRKPEELPPTLS